MIRPFTFLTMLLAAVSGAYLFAVKHRAQVLEDQIAATADASRVDAQRIRVLQAQWALEIDPNRLNQLAAKFTTLTPMKPAQLITLAALRDVLPPAGSAAPGANPEGGRPDLPMAGAPIVANAAGAAGAAPNFARALPLPPDAAPQPPMRLAVAPPAERGPARMPRAHSMLHLADTKAVKNLPPPRPLYAARATFASASPAMPLGAALMSVKAVAAPAAPNGGSMLGMAAEMPPPLPLNGTAN
jgi:hypothetical protein